MGAYNKKRLLQASAAQIPQIADAIRKEFQYDDFEVQIDELMSGGRDISVTKGNLFKAVLGMRSALKITLLPQSDGVLFDANVGIFGQQSIPTIISMFFFWPVLITQIWGLVQQSRLDTRVMKILAKVVEKKPEAVGATSCEADSPARFCSECGKPITGNFCANCGAKV